MGVDKSASENCAPPPQTNRRQLEQGDAIVGDSDHNGAQNKELHGTDDPMIGCCSRDVMDSELATLGSSRSKLSTPNNRKRKRRSDDPDPKTETPTPPAEPETNRKPSRVMTRRRKSVS